jgi:hypothetical protein
VPARGWDVPSKLVGNFATVTSQNDLGRMGSSASFIMIEYRERDHKASNSITTFANYSSIMFRSSTSKSNLQSQLSLLLRTSDLADDDLNTKVLNLEGLGLID